MSPSPPPGPSLARLGLNPLGQLLIGLNVVALAAGVAFFSAGRLAIEWSTVWLGASLFCRRSSSSG